jgi:hypothetical protein
MFGIGPPGAQAFFVLLGDSAALAVFRIKALVGNIARHGASEFAHAIHCGGVFVLKSWPDTSAKNSNKHILGVLFEIEIVVEIGLMACK